MTKSKTTFITLIKPESRRRYLQKKKKKRVNTGNFLLF